jgi:hypothetical protein
MIKQRDTYHSYDTQRTVKEYYNHLYVDHLLNYEGSNIPLINNKTGNAPVPSFVSSELFHDGIRRISSGSAMAASLSTDSWFNEGNIITVTDDSMYIMNTNLRLDVHDATDTWEFWFGISNNYDLSLATEYAVFRYNYNLYGDAYIYYETYDGIDKISNATAYALSDTEKQWYKLQFVINTIMDETSLLIGQNDGRFEGSLVMEGSFVPSTFGIHHTVHKHQGNMEQRTIDIDYTSLHVIHHNK